VGAQKQSETLPQHVFGMAETGAFYPTGPVVVGAFMSDVISPPQPASRVMHLPRILVLAIGIFWAVMLLLHAFDSGPVDSVSTCRQAIYRDPLTGQERGIGETRIAADGSMTCRGTIYHPASR